MKDAAEKQFAVAIDHLCNAQALDNVSADTKDFHRHFETFLGAGLLVEAEFQDLKAIDSSGDFDFDLVADFLSEQPLR